MICMKKDTELDIYTKKSSIKEKSQIYPVLHSKLIGPAMV